MRDRLVTLIGGGGFLGRYVTQALLRQGARVRIVERDPRRAWYLKPQGGLGQTQFVAADVTRPQTLARALHGSDAAVNLVGAFTNLVAVNADGAGAAAKAARAAGVQAFVQVSAIGADPASPSAYGRSKAMGEAAVREAFPEATILRPSILFGSEDQFLNRFAAMVATAPVVPVLRSGCRFQPLYVADAAEAVAAALAHPEAHGGKIYELGGPDVVTMGALIWWIAREIGRSPAILELPDFAGSLISMLPGGPITRDQWLMLQRDNVVSPDAAGIAALGIAPTPMAAVAPAWLVRFRRHGRFGRLGSPA